MTASNYVRPKDLRPGLVIRSDISSAWAIILDARPFPGTVDRYAALIFDASRGRRIWYRDTLKGKPRSLVEINNSTSWVEAEGPLGYDAELFREAPPMGIDLHCLITEPAFAMEHPSGAQCLHCGGTVSHKCACPCEDCSEEVTYWGDSCNDCLDNCNDHEDEDDEDEDEEVECAVCGSNYHGVEDHEYCETCGAYGDHDTSEHKA